LYFEDLSPYEYDHGQPVGNVVNVGWLSRDHDYESGSVPQEFVAAVRKLVATPVNLYRGVHLCEFCPDPPKGRQERRRLKGWISP
jgi:hypothetical protein